MTRFEQIAAAFPLHAQRIAELCTENGMDTWLFSEATRNETESTTIFGGFHWDETTEGGAYWSALCNRAYQQ